MDGPILKDWQYFTFWGCGLAFALSAVFLALRILTDIRSLLLEIRDRLK